MSIDNQLLSLVYLLSCLFCISVGFWISDRYHPARLRLKSIKNLMRSQLHDISIPEKYRYQSFWANIWEEVAPYEEE